MDKNDLAEVIDQAVTEKLARLEARRYGRTEKPRQTVDETNASPDSRYVAAPVKRAVWERDEGRCTFVDGHGRRCKERAQLELHHRQPFGKGGDHSVDNLALLCRAHNAYVAELDYGKEKMAKYLGSANRVSEPRPVYGLPFVIPRPPPATQAVRVPWWNTSCQRRPRRTQMDLRRDRLSDVTSGTTRGASSERR